MKRLDTLQRRLYTRLPVIGGWLRKRAVRALASNGSPGAIQALAEAVTRSDDRAVRAIALEALRQVNTQPRVDAAVAVWVATRHPDLAALLVQYGWVAHAPEHARVLSALKSGRPELVTGAGAEVVEPLVLAGQDADPVLAGLARTALCQLHTPEAQEAVCQLVIQGDSPPARQAALAAGYLPRDPLRRALFYFLTEQWSPYQALDFDQRMVRAAYEAGDPELRRRIMEKLRNSGRTDYLTIITGSDYRARAASMTASEAEFLVHMLAGNREWGQLWGLVSTVPLAWSVRIVQQLAAAGWQPEHDEERPQFQELTALAASPLILSELEARRLLPPAVRRAQARLSGRINDLAFAPLRPVLALGTARRKVVTWNFQRAAVEQVVGGFQHSVSRIAFAGAGILLAAERSHSRAECGIYAWRDGTRLSLGAHQGSITALEPFGKCWLLSSGRDQRVVVWNVEDGRPEAEQSFDFWARAVAISGDGRQAALLHQGVTGLNLPQLDDIRHIHAPGRWSVATCAAFAPDGQGLVIGKFNGEVVMLEQVNHRHSGTTLLKHDRPVQGIEVRRPPGESPAAGETGAVIITAGAEGTIRFIAWADHAAVGSVQAPGERLTSLHVSPDGAYMAVGTADAALSLWDLRVLEVPALFSQPLAGVAPFQLAAVRVLSEQAGLPSSIQRSLKFLERVLQHRFRYEIDIDELPAIRLGEFDIEVE
jgi:WD40 repeat protein